MKLPSCKQRNQNRIKNATQKGIARFYTEKMEVFSTVIHSNLMLCSCNYICMLFVSKSNNQRCCAWKISYTYSVVSCMLHICFACTRLCKVWWSVFAQDKLFYDISIHRFLFLFPILSYETRGDVMSVSLKLTRLNFR